MQMNGLGEGAMMTRVAGGDMMLIAGRRKADDHLSLDVSASRERDGKQRRQPLAGHLQHNHLFHAGLGLVVVVDADTSR
jgi:hypothetical protein